MGTSLMGIETEHGLALMGGEGGASHRRFERQVLARSLMREASTRLVHLPAYGQPGIHLANGGRVYLDTGSTPEYATPECATPDELVAAVGAGDRIMARLAAAAFLKVEPGREVVLWRGNCDHANPRVTWGSHESYLYRRDLQPYHRFLIAHLVTRIVFCGSGGLDPRSPGIDFLVSPRSIHLKTVVGGDSTRARGILHLRDESLARPGFRRLHLICGDALCSETALWLRVATTALVVAMLDAGTAPRGELSLRAPLTALRSIARDTGARRRVRLNDGRLASAIEIQREFLACARRSLGASFMPDWAETACARWGEMLDRLETGPESLTWTLDWPMRQALFARHAQRRGFGRGRIRLWNTVCAALLRAQRLAARAASKLSESPPLTGETGLVTPPAASAALARVIERLRAFRRAGHQDDAPAYLFPPEAAADPGLDRFERALRRRGESWEGLESFRRLRSELFELDIRFGQLGLRGIFAALDAAGHLSHRVVDPSLVERLVERAPGSGRASLRGAAIRTLYQQGGQGSASWESVVSPESGRMLDLSDPFAAEERWIPFDGRRTVRPSIEDLLSSLEDDFGL